ncbi:Holliday junction resolvase RecU [Anoxybacillus rupiensis]|uniref:Holliday junction resolvase RecU n=1 Tax=Anoxybacteroides rupiense TaxID=311460 RepID=A0ABD5IX19_9BACL|nr:MULTISPECIES: Holliday junction resolvase RecU [Anoxybacillus]KXG11000.1 Holliday junction resolvase RecU [Anoxybacillus sp. P3H1B]MBB3906577.1 recombination protein U [Anoxybacillus rupiensis]MBS2770300.1 Holliday junction resolvase RecU [Anoxybacillus rupiensis]MDE8562323.1 Holliday junction resolvase RecU [Anoxybacillus rupiensis]MED5051951.1 Holliday junction resolvase RecU [Anoxybacillus rupiensis]
MFKYPGGRQYKVKETEEAVQPLHQNYGNRGMTLEEDLNSTNEYYREHGIAIIHKKPTPIQIVRVDYPKRSAAVIKEAYFKQASTTDYNGVYRGKYIDFEAKETRNTTSFPLKNFHEHQIQHMRQVLQHGAICFVILRFASLGEVYLLDASHLLSFWERQQSGGRKSLTKQEIEQYGHHISLGYQPRIDYIRVVENIYF